MLCMAISKIRSISAIEHTSIAYCKQYTHTRAHKHVHEHICACARMRACVCMCVFYFYYKRYIYWVDSELTSTGQGNRKFDMNRLYVNFFLGNTFL